MKMYDARKILLISILTITAINFAAVPAQGQKGYGEVVKHLKSKYKAKKVKIPFMFLARFAVRVVRPAGVKSLSVTLFEDLKFSRSTLDAEMQAILKNSLSAEWSPILRVRSRTGEQVYMYMRESGDNVKIFLVTIDRTEAAVIRAKLDPEKLAEFVNDPKIFGISLDGENHHNADKSDENAAENPDRDDDDGEILKN